MPFLKKWTQFSLERFHPAAYLVMIPLFVLGHVKIYQVAYPGNSVGILASLLLILGCFAFFFKLRLFDEIKDYEFDLQHNPDRPLARELVSHRDLYRGIVAMIVVECVCFGLVSGSGLITVALAMAYSLLMFKEFFIGKWIRPLLTTYALTHTLVSGLLSLAIFSALSHQLPWEYGSLQSLYLLFAINSWMIFNVFEFGRKTFSGQEERESVDSYSKRFGRQGAVALVMGMVALSSLALYQAGLTSFAWLFVALAAAFAALGVLGTLFTMTDQEVWASAYRKAVSAYLVLVYALILALPGGLIS